MGFRLIPVGGSVALLDGEFPSLHLETERLDLHHVTDRPLPADATVQTQSRHALIVR